MALLAELRPPPVDLRYVQRSQEAEEPTSIVAAPYDVRAFTAGVSGVVERDAALVVTDSALATGDMASPIGATHGKDFYDPHNAPFPLPLLFLVDGKVLHAKRTQKPRKRDRCAIG